MSERIEAGDTVEFTTGTAAIECVVISVDYGKKIARVRTSSAVFAIALKSLTFVKGNK